VAAGRFGDGTDAVAAVIKPRLQADGVGDEGDTVVAVVVVRGRVAVAIDDRVQLFRVGVIGENRAVGQLALVRTVGQLLEDGILPNRSHIGGGTGRAVAAAFAAGRSAGAYPTIIVAAAAVVVAVVVV